MIAEPAAVPGTMLSLVQIAAPDIAVLVVVGLGLGPSGLRAVGRRFRFWSPEVGLRRGLTVWGACVATFVAADLAVAGLRSVLLSDGAFAFDWSAWLPGLFGALLVAMFLDAGGLFEENGWRGFMQPALQQRDGPFVASLVVGAAWGPWHLPVKLDIWLNHGPLGGLAVFAVFVVSLVAVSVVIAFFFNRAGEATVIAVAMHGMFNDSRGIAGWIGYSTFRDELLDLVCVSIAYGAVATVLVLATRGRLGVPRRPATSSPDDRGTEGHRTENHRTEDHRTEDHRTEGRGTEVHRTEDHRTEDHRTEGRDTEVHRTGDTRTGDNRGAAPAQRR